MGLGTMHIRACLPRFDWLNKPRLHVVGNFRTTDNPWPYIKRGGLDQGWIEGHVVKIIVQKMAAPTVPCVARNSDARAALPPMASAANVISGQIGEKDIGAAIAALGSTLQASTCGRKRGEIGIVVHRDQHVCIFGVVLVFRQGTDEGNSPNARAGASTFDEPQDFIKQKAADRRASVLRHHVYGA